MKIKIAETKICPHLSAIAQVAVSCEASECMMWEPDSMRETKEIALDEKNELSPIRQVPKGWRNGGVNREKSPHVLTVFRYVNDPNNGDCGLKTKYLECSGG